jgi:hypothetical protein
VKIAMVIMLVKKLRMTFRPTVRSYCRNVNLRIITNMTKCYLYGTGFTKCDPNCVY